MSVRLHSLSWQGCRSFHVRRDELELFGNLDLGIFRQEYFFQPEFYLAVFVRHVFLLARNRRDFDFCLSRACLGKEKNHALRFRREQGQHSCLCLDRFVGFGNSITKPAIAKGGIIRYRESDADRKIECALGLVGDDGGILTAQFLLVREIQKLSVRATLHWNCSFSPALNLEADVRWM